MSKDNQGSDQVFELGRIRKLIELLREFDLSEIDLQDGEQRIQIKRGGQPVITGFQPAAAVAAASAAAPAARVEDDKHVSFIKSPMVGSFYSRPKPDQPSFVKVGDVVSPETIVCIVEAMKMFNEIPAGIAGKIVEICVKDGEAVDVNKPLFKLAT